MTGSKWTIVSSRRRWPNAEVPYTLDAAFTADERAVIAAGIADIQATTCIRYSMGWQFYINKFQWEKH